jgi:hypothetical protein
MRQGKTVTKRAVAKQPVKTQKEANQALANYFRLHRRYHRSINLERDFDQPDAVEGYVLTERSGDALQRILTAIGRSRAHHAWILTGSYGTGKSAFALFLTALCAPTTSPVSQTAIALARQSLPADSPIFDTLAEFPSKGLLRAVVAGAREPLRWTIVRALSQVIDHHWPQEPRPEALRDVIDWESEISGGRCAVTNQQILTALRQLVQMTDTDLLLVVDELGKNLEYAAQHRSTEDLYLLQQITELGRKGQKRIYFLGLLHQSFVGYGERLSAVEQNEWNKIQGRFETLQLMESPSQMTRLIGQAIAQSDAIAHLCQSQAEDWYAALQTVLVDREISSKVLAATYPLHPLTALVLPLLCTRYAQNDRSLFTFLTSDEPHGLTRFLQVHQLQVDPRSKILDDKLHTLKLDQLYDYFVESTSGLSSQMHVQRWVEIQSLIQEARSQGEDVLKVLKTIGILNLVASLGTLKATPDIVSLALCDRPDDQAAVQHWKAIIHQLQTRGVITYRSQADELRIWEGSDFDVESAIAKHIEERQRSPLAQLLTTTHPLKPVVAQRHYTTTGNLRYFEQRYIDSLTSLENLHCDTPGADGLILYWVDAETSLPAAPTQTTDDKPLILVTTQHLDLLRVRAQYLQALKTIQKNASELVTDGVARREVKHRLLEAERLLNETMQQAFGWRGAQNQCWIAGQPQAIANPREFQSALSSLCDRTYSQGLILDNELINRRELTSQGAKARRELIEAMLEKFDQAQLGLEGYGPEVAMYNSVLKATGIHRQEAGEWNFYPPHENSGVSTLWQSIEQFVLEAKEKPQSIGQLYQHLSRPPYGIKAGVIPVLLLAVLLYYIDEVSLYKDGTFIPVLGSEHFELLVKAPDRFAVKHIEVAGLRSQVFKELETALRSPNAKTPARVRNASLLAVAKPLFGFVRQLPEFTRATKRLNPEALKVLQALQTAQEPDELLFISLPEACGFNPMTAVEEENEQAAKAFRKKLVQCIHEIQFAYDNLLSDCQKLLYEAFGVRSKEANLREDLRVRASYLAGQCIDPVLRHFVSRAVEEDSSDRDWLEALVRIVADKHPKSWIDEDFSRFEIALSELVRRFQNLESLWTEIRQQGKGFDALRIAVTEPNGQEVHEVVWINEEHEELFDRLAEEVLNKPALKDNPRLQKGFLAKLNEKLLSRKDVDSQGEFGKPKRKRDQSA